MNFSILYLVFSSVYVTKHLLLLIEVSVIGPQMSDDILAPGCAVDGGFLRCGALCCFPWAHAEQVRCGGVDLSSFGRSLGILVWAIDWTIFGWGWFSRRCHWWWTSSVFVSFVGWLGCGSCGVLLAYCCVWFFFFGSSVAILVATGGWDGFVCLVCCLGDLATNVGNGRLFGCGCAEFALVLCIFSL